MSKCLSKIMLSICFIGQLLFVFGQNEQDSLLYIISTTDNDSLKAEAFNELSWVKLRTASKESEVYADSAVYLARKNNLTITLITAYNRKGTAVYYQQDYPRALKIYNMVLEMESAQSGNYYGIGRAHNQLSLIHKELGNTSRALEHCKQAFQYYNNHGYEDYANNLLLVEGNLYQQVSDFDSALYCYLRAMDMAVEKGNYSQEALANLNIGVLEIKLENYLKAIQHLRRANVMFSVLGDKREMSNVYNNLGITFFQLDKLKFLLLQQL